MKIHVLLTLPFITVRSQSKKKQNVSNVSAPGLFLRPLSRSILDITPTNGTMSLNVSSDIRNTANRPILSSAIKIDSEEKRPLPTLFILQSA